MKDYFSQNAGQILDGFLFGLGVLAIYLGAVFTATLIRSLGGAGTKGITVAGRYAQGWFYYLRGDDRDIVNVTLNVIVDNQLKFDTIVADQRIWFVWPNAYRQLLIRRAAQRTTEDDPVIRFPQQEPAPKSALGRLRQRCGQMIGDRLASVTVVQDGKTRRVRLMREDDYKAAYGPLISLVSEKCSNDHAIDLALGRPMDEYRFVIALTYEKLNNRRARHLRAMVMWEEALLNLPAECPRVEKEEHNTRFRTLQAIARQYCTHPERFGTLNIWRPRGAAPPVPDSLNDMVRLAPAQSAK